MTAPSTLDTVYCTDEDIVVQAGADFPALAARRPRLAYGTDGFFDVDSPWNLQSASIDFAGAGVTSNMVVVLSKSAFKSFEILAVDSVATGSLTLRWPGLAAGVGLAPGLFTQSAGGQVTGVTFEVRTLKPQIEDVAYELNEAYAIDPLIPLRTPADIYNQRILRRLSVLAVLYRAYCDEARTDKGDWKQKIDRYRGDLEEARAKAALRWGPTGQSQQTTTRFSTRLSR